MKLIDLLKVLDPSTVLVICYAGFGQRMYEGNIEDIPTHMYNYYVTYVSHNRYKMYIEVHENKGFLED